MTDHLRRLSAALFWAIALMFTLFLGFNITAEFTNPATCISTHTITTQHVRFVDGWPRVTVEPLLICDDYSVSP